jgi:two-component system, NtrC family, response regulator AtoC
MAQKPFRIFVVEDNEWYNKLLVHTLSLNPDYEIKSFYNANDFLRALNESPDVVTLDFRLPDMSGLDVLKRIKQNDNEIQVILISEQDDTDVVVSLLKLGAFDYITKSNDIKDRLLNTIQNLRNGIGLRNEITLLKKEIQHKYSFRQIILGESPSVKNVFDLIEKAANTNITVTISGETGTGKELVAKAIHYNSRRKDKPFVAVNVPAIPSELIESELFGHEKGAFTGAAFRRIGRFEEADGGTLFLDEIGEMEPSLQSKLLRTLQEKEIVRIGSNKAIPTDCRIIAATNKNLRQEVKKGRFREDLFYRLLGLPIELPPLRERGTDVLILAHYFVKEFCLENNIEVKKLSPEALKKLMNYNFPGNVRELKSLMELAVTISSRDEIDASDFAVSAEDAYTIAPGQEMTLREYEMKIIKATLRHCNNDISLAAKKLDIGVSTIYRLLKIERESENQ